MWLLSTDRAELHYFPSPEQVPDGYAALSHVWDKEGEQTFQEIREIERVCKQTGVNPRDVVCKKIRRCCRLAQKHDHRWVWIDTCCIDKTSSAELSEAINSMFHYYSLASVCYGYLRDVDDPPAPSNKETWTLPALDTTSVWFSRGWTLQELIAPHLFLFVSQSWKVLGTKADYAELLEETTGIPADVLRLELSYTTTSIAQRMSWFGDRKTTRVEDEAYCLLGLFGVHMPTLYGEGRNAFQRLQEEIMKQSVDTTLFAWMGKEESPQNCSCLFAPSPAAFRLSDEERQWRIEYTPPSKTSGTDKHWTSAPTPHIKASNDITISLTPYGVLASLQIISNVPGPEIGSTSTEHVMTQWHNTRHTNNTHNSNTSFKPPTSPRNPSGIYADLFWSRSHKNGRRYRGLLPLEVEKDIQAHSSRYPSYRIFNSPPGRNEGILWVPFSEKPNQYEIGQEIFRASWQDILLRRCPPPRRLVGQPLPDPYNILPAIPWQFTLNAPFRFDKIHIEKFLHQSPESRVNVYSSSRASIVGDSKLAVTYAFFDVGHHRLLIQIGRCVSGKGRHLTSAVWARVVYLLLQEGDKETVELMADPHHDCSHDHVSLWPDSQKKFTLDTVTRGDDGKHQPMPAKGVVTLSFTPCHMNPRTLVLNATYGQLKVDKKKGRI